MDDDVILRVVEDGAIAREKDNDEKDECAIIIVVVVVVAIFVLLFSLSFPCVFLLGEKKWRRREKGFHRNIKTSRKGGVSSFHVMPLSKKGPPSSSSSFPKKKKGKENLVGFDRFFYKRSGGKILLRFPALFFPCLIVRGPTINRIYSKKRRARAPSEGAFGTKTKETSRPITTITTTTTKHEEEELAQTCTNTRDDDSTTTKCRRIRWRN